MFFPIIYVSLRIHRNMIAILWKIINSWTLIIFAFAKKCKVNTLLGMLSTIHRRHILSFLEKKKTTSLRSLKEAFVDTHEMNQTTLYRIMEKFTNEWIVHKVEHDREKYFTLCQCENKEEAITLKCCVNCHFIEENHHPLGPDALKSETVELVKICTHCK